SVAYEMNVYNGHVIGTAFAANGTAGTYTGTGLVNFRGDGTTGDPTNVTLSYDPVSGTVTENLFDSVNNATFTQVITVGHLTALLGGGSTALFGFTGATGGLNARQTITNFSFAPGTDSNYTNNVVLTGGASSTIDISTNGPS